MEPIMILSALFFLTLAGSVTVLLSQTNHLAFASTEGSEGIGPGVSGNKTNAENDAPIPPDSDDSVDSQESQDEVDPYDDSTGRPVISQPIPYDSPDFSDRSDFKAEALPTEDIVSYQTSFLNPGEVAELRFLVEPGYVAVLRVVPEGRELNLNGFERVFQESVQHLQSDGRSVLLFNNSSGAALALWSKNGFDYALYFERTEMGLFTGSTETFLEQTNFVKSE